MSPLDLIPGREDIDYFEAPWRISDDALFELTRLLVRLKPRTILELGPGLSSYPCFVYQRMVAQYRSPVYVDYHVVDQDGPWHARFRDWCKRHEFPMTGVWPVSARNCCYQAGQLDFGATDLILIDGPGSSPYATADDTQRQFLGRHLSTRSHVLVCNSSCMAGTDLVVWLHEQTKARGGRGLSVEHIWDSVEPSRRTTFLTPIPDHRD